MLTVVAIPVPSGATADALFVDVVFQFRCTTDELPDRVRDWPYSVASLQLSVTLSDATQSDVATGVWTGFAEHPASLLWDLLLQIANGRQWARSAASPYDSA